jgi:hypothetical protein
MHNNSIVLSKDEERFRILRGRNSLQDLNIKNVHERTIDSTYNPSLSAALATLSALINAAEGPIALTFGHMIRYF